MKEILSSLKTHGDTAPPYSIRYNTHLPHPEVSDFKESEVATHRKKSFNTPTRAPVQPKAL